jgi:hypothetical protein
VEEWEKKIFFGVVAYGSCWRRANFLGRENVGPITLVALFLDASWGAPGDYFKIYAFSSFEIHCITVLYSFIHFSHSDFF